MNRKIIQSSLLLLSILWSATGYTQDYASSKEKIYIQSSHVFFQPGDVLYLKAWVVKGQDNTPTKQSKILHIEYISPSGTLLQKASYPIRDGVAEGSFAFTDQMPGGIYKIRAYTNWMQNETENRYFNKEIILQKVIAPRILLKLDFPEKGYGPGSMVRAAFTMRSLDNLPISNKQANFTVHIGGIEYMSQSFKTDNSGTCQIQFTLPEDLTVTDGLLNIKVLHDGFSESISRSIPIVLNKIDLQFMPEGGTLVNGYKHTIAFKSLNEFGKATDIEGDIIDEAGFKVTSFKSYHFGMGKFELTPQTGKTYYAVINAPAGIKQKYRLPMASVQGLMLSLTKKEKKINFTITSTVSMEIKLKGSSHGTTYFQKKITLLQGVNSIVLDEAVFPPGIAQFTVYDCNEWPLAERMMFLQEEHRLQVKISFNKPVYNPREKVILNIKSLDQNNKPIPADFALSVMDDKLWTFADDKQDHLLSWLLLGSELKGKVEEPQFYFRQDEPRAAPALDLLMLTQGYRYFDYTELVTKENKLQVLPEQDYILSGRVLNSQQKPVASKVFLIHGKINGSVAIINSDINGHFLFSGLELNSQYYVYAQALDKKEKTSIQILENGLAFHPERLKYLKPLSDPLPSPIKPFFAADPLLVNQDEKKEDEKSIIKQFPATEQNSAMSEVVVMGYATSVRRKEIVGSVSIINGIDIRQTNLNNALAGKVSGMQVRSQSDAKLGNAGTGNIRLRGETGFASGNETLLIVDGFPTQDISNLNNSDIQDVTVLAGPAGSAIFGSSARNGVIIINTHKSVKGSFRIETGANHYYSSEIIRTLGNLFTPAKKFYAPVYKTTETESRTDYRETIYWNPIVQTNKDGVATVEFYNSDANSAFRAIAEGVGYNGLLGRVENTYAVENILQADLKIPPYLTVGDSALLPLVVKNNSEIPGVFTIDAEISDDFIIGPFETNLHLQPKSSKQVLIPVQARSATSDTIEITIKGSAIKEKIRLPLKVAEKGFPVHLTFSGNTAAQHDFMIRNMIPGTLQSNLRLFKNTEGQLLDGIESMLREPYGCFEQTSSTTYPNVFILKYLKESGRSNREIEAKALNYIQKGYKRLIGFETTQNGFEWFGKAPAHEALTAYGLLEFTDMQEFISVDQEMLDRTKKYLLSRRDQKGGFLLASGGYDRFASVPNKIANTYIVYAMTQAGMGKEIQKEYDAALKIALQSKDGYQLAMMAIAADHMKDKESFQKIMTELDRSYLLSGLVSETSVVNSRGASLRVESHALYALALMLQPEPNILRINELLATILKEKAYYGYGSTQATVLALKAVVSFSKLVGQMAEDANVQFTLNHTPVLDLKTSADHLKEGTNHLVVNYLKPDAMVPYDFDVQYSTHQPPTSPQAELSLSISLNVSSLKTGETARMEIAVTNKSAVLQPMAIAKIGIPAGLSVQPWQLKEIMEKNQAAYYEIFDNYVVFYWMGFARNETKKIVLDLKAEIPGVYKAKSGNVYLYYTPEHKFWVEGSSVNIDY